MQNALSHPIIYGLTKSNRDENLGWYTNWYTQHNIVDLMVGMLSVGKSTAVNLGFFDKKSGKGFNNFRSVIVENVAVENLSWSADVIDSLQDQIVYHPILRLSAEGNQDSIKRQLNKALDGIDGIDSSGGEVNQHYGTPKAIIIPVLMNDNHFGALTIFPKSNTGQAKVYYFNSLGVGHGYKNTEESIFRSLEQRYVSGVEIKNNGSLAWQNDSNQCGPYVIWFVESVVQHLTEKCSSMEEILADRFAIGSKYDSMEDTVEKRGFLVELEGAKELRKYQANYVKGLQSAHFIYFALQFEEMVKENVDWHKQSNILFTVRKNTNEHIDEKRSNYKLTDITTKSPTPHQYSMLTKCAKIAVAGVVVICAAALLHKYIGKENWQKLASSIGSIRGEGGPLSGVL